jgi:Fe-S-cluster containining protein
MAYAVINLCACCAQKGKTCCQGREIYVSPGDVQRITLYTGQSDFYEWTGVQDPSYLDQVDDPVWQHHVFRADGKRRTLKHCGAEDCIFLAPAGCRLPEAVRPLVCRLHPFDYTAAGIAPDPAPGCPRELVAPGATLIEALHMSPSQAGQWHHMLYMEIMKEGESSGWG